MSPLKGWGFSDLEQHILAQSVGYRASGRFCSEAVSLGTEQGKSQDGSTINNGRLGRRSPEPVSFSCRDCTLRIMISRQGPKPWNQAELLWEKSEVNLDL